MYSLCTGTLTLGRQVYWMPKPQDILGQKFGRLMVISATEEKDPNGRTLYECQCDCGETKKVPAYLLLGGRVTSCGCARKGHVRSPEVESERVKQIYTQAVGVYQRGKFWVAQMKFSGITYHILSTPDKEEAVAARQKIVQLRMESGDDVAIEYLEQQKEARKEERRELMKRFGGFPTREEMAKMKKK